MTWFKLDDTWLSHPKMYAAGLHGRALWLAGGLHCAQHLTDGRIEKEVVPVLAVSSQLSARSARESTAKLLQLGLWIDHGSWYEMHDFLVYQPARETVLKARQNAAERQQRAREKGAASRRDSQRDSRRESQRESRSPRPDPTRPQKEEELRAGITQDPGTINQPPPDAAERTAPAPVRLTDLTPPALAVPIIAERRLIDRTAATKAGPARWSAAARRRILTDETAPLAAQHPDWTAEQLADHIEPPAPPTGWDHTGCPECDGRRVTYTETTTGVDVTPCTTRIPAHSTPPPAEQVPSATDTANTASNGVHGHTAGAPRQTVAS